MAERTGPKMEKIPLKHFPERAFQPGFVSAMTYGEDMEFEVLAEHWHASLQASVRAIRADEGTSRVYWGSIGGNYVAFPIIYNYRHVLELYLKGMLMAGEAALVIAGEEPVPDEIFKAHSFQTLRPEIERVFKVLGVPYDLGVTGFETKADFWALLKDMDKMEIRYPVDTKRQPAMGTGFMCFNLFEFAEIMDAVLNALNGFLGGIRYEVDARQHRISSCGFPPRASRECA